MLTPIEKKWYMSKGVWVGLLILILGVFRVDVDNDLMTTINDNAGNIITAVLGAVTVYNRIAASTTVETPQWLPGARLPGTPAEYAPPQAQPYAPPYQPQYQPQPQPQPYGQVAQQPMPTPDPSYYPPQASGPYAASPYGNGPYGNAVQG